MNFAASSGSIIRFAATTALALALLVLAGTAPAEAGTVAPKCTIKGTKGPDRLVGTPKRDVICGFGGKDVLVGNDGRDVLLGGAGADRMLGGRGPDRLDGGPGDDRLLGQPQNDRLDGGPGDDFLDGGSGINIVHGGPGLNRCLPGAADTLAGTCDNTPPVLADLRISRNSVDATTEDSRIDIMIRVTDDISGARDNISPEIAHPATGQRFHPSLKLASGDASNGVYRGSFKLGAFAAQGRWTIGTYLADKAGNSTWVSPEQIGGMGLPNGFNQTGRGDNEKPKIHSLSIDRNSINTSSSDQSIHVRMRITDDYSGISMDHFDAVGFIVIHPGTNSQIQADTYLVSGTDTDGIYEGDVVIPRYSPQGKWELRVGALDRAGNMMLHNASELAGMGFPSSISQTGTGDSEEPQLIELSTSPTHVDTTDGPQTVTYTVRATDNLSGIWGHVSAYLKSNGVGTPHSEALVRISGTALNGVYQGSVELPQGSVNGNWTAAISISDQAGNSVYFEEPDLTALGFSSAFTNGP